VDNGLMERRILSQKHK